MDKEYILKEIKRTAEENGGIPLGVASFFRETGVKEFDWRGKIWARWGDAVREAGFEPNQKQAAYDENFLIEKVLTLVRDLGHFPTVSEMRLKVRNDGAFPNHKTIRRLGSNQELAAKIQTYCNGRAGYDDVVDICALVAQPHDASPEKGREPEEIIGFVYLIKAGRYYKIGRSNAVGRREYEIALQLPERANTIHTIRTDDPTGIEAYWHKRFAAKRKNGEWFELTSVEINAFKRRKFM